MRVNGVDRINDGVKKADNSWLTDSKSKEFQNQIANEQNRLKDLAADNKLGEEEKEKKRKEIQQKITELNNQLRQHQMELRREKQEKNQKADMSEEEQRNGTAEEKFQDTGMQETGMRAMISADSAISHANASSNLVMAVEGRVRVLQAEIKQDEVYGKNTEQKKKELEKLEGKVVKLNGSKMNFLAKASREMKEAAQKELYNDERGLKKKKSGENTVAAPFSSVTKQKTGRYIKGNLFSNVDFHF